MLSAAKLSSELRKKYSEVEWKNIINTRNRIVHEYGGIDYKIVEYIVNNELPKLLKDAERILNELKTEKK